MRFEKKTTEALLMGGRVTEAEWSCCFLGTPHLGGGFNFRTLSPLLVEMMQFDEYVSNGLKDLKVENNKYIQS